MREFFRAFTYAAAGIVRALKERNMRFHVCAGATVIRLGLFYKLSAGEWCVIFLCIGLVMTAETINTAVEAAVDLISQGKHSSLAKAAKDCSAGAVLISACTAAAAGIVIFGDMQKAGEMVSFFKGSPLCAVGLAAWVIFCAVYIIFGGKGRKK